MLCSLLRLSCRKMGAQNGLILRRIGFQVIINDDFLEEGECFLVYTQSLTIASGRRLCGSVVEHWIFNPAARVRFPLKSWDFFQPNLLCFVLCYGFHVVRT